jgi:hypothetical protein
LPPAAAARRLGAQRFDRRCFYPAGRRSADVHPTRLGLNRLGLNRLGGRFGGYPGVAARRSSSLRAVMAKFARYINGDIHVLAFTEIPDDKQVTIEASIG